MDYIYISQNGDRESILERRNQLMVLSDKEIVPQYNREAKMGIVGVRAQILHIIALHHVFLKRFRKSPIKIVDNMVISLTGKIIYIPIIKTFFRVAKI